MTSVVAVDRSDADMDKYPHEVKPPTEVWMLSEFESVKNVHSRDKCVGACPLHNPSNHDMRDYPLHHRNDRGIFERICSHVVGHPDPDAYDYLEQRLGKKGADAEFIHGCDGCCSVRTAFGARDTEDHS